MPRRRKYEHLKNEMLRKFYVEDKTTTTIAYELGIPEKTIQNYIKKYYKDEADEWGKLKEFHVEQCDECPSDNSFSVFVIKVVFVVFIVWLLLVNFGN